MLILVSGLCNDNVPWSSLFFLFTCNAFVAQQKPKSFHDVLVYECFQALFVLVYILVYSQFTLCVSSSSSNVIAKMTQ